MIHTIHTMTVGRYVQLDKTADMNLLRLWWNPLPVKWFTKRVERFFDDARSVFNPEDENNEFFDDVEKLYMVNRMLHLSVLYDGLCLALLWQSKIKAYIHILKREGRKDDSLDVYRKAVKELTGIEINTAEDLVKLQAELTRRADKFKEMYPEDNSERPTFARVALSVFSMMEIPYSEKMTVYEFGELKKMAIERKRQYDKQLKKYGAD